MKGKGPCNFSTIVPFGGHDFCVIDSSTQRDDISTPFFVAVELFEREMIHLRPFSRQRRYKYLAMAREPYLSPPRPLVGPPDRPLAVHSGTD